MIAIEYNVSYIGSLDVNYLESLSEKVKIFDDGIWWIEKDSSELHLGSMEVYLNGEYKGECSRLDFGHKVSGSPSWPTVAVIYASGYIRLKEFQEADVNFGTSFVLGPAYWEGETYHHHPIVKEIFVNQSAISSGLWNLELTAETEHLHLNYNILMKQTDGGRIELEVEEKFVVVKPFVLNRSRFENHEGFKLIQFSTMYIDEYFHDSNGVRYIDETGELVDIKFQYIGKDCFIFSDPQKLGLNWLEVDHSDNEGWQGNTPNCIIFLNDPILAADCTPQGWIGNTLDPTDDNLGLWIHFDNASLEWDVNDGKSVSYSLIARDNPLTETSDNIQPNIMVSSRNPSGDVLPEQPVNVLVNVTDFGSGVKNVTLFYTIDNGSNWENLSMNYNTSTNLYVAEIPGHQAETIVNFKVVAYDYAINNSTLVGTEPYCPYQIISEYPSWGILLFFIIISIFAVIVTKRLFYSSKLETCFF